MMEQVALSRRIFFTSSDLQKPENLSTLTAEEVLEELEGNDDIYANYPDESSEDEDSDDEDGDCISNILDDVEIVVQGDSLVFGVQTSPNECFEKEFSGDGFNISALAVDLKIFIKIRCVGIDLEKYQGKKFSEIADDLEAEDKNCTSKETAYSFLLSYDMSAQFTTNGTTTDAQLKSVSKSFEGTESLDACVKTKSDSNWLTSDDCVLIDISESETKIGDADPAIQKTYTKLSPSSLVSSQDEAALWHSSGSLAAEINDWSATLSYSSPDAAPSYVLTDTSGASTSGTLTAQASSLKLTSIPKSIVQKARKIDTEFSSFFRSVR